tara:strand:+ start:748 stop:3462 length:2715 start_codon:yes stop_codon:yes gene_type:complete
MVTKEQLDFTSKPGSRFYKPPKGGRRKPKKPEVPFDEQAFLLDSHFFLQNLDWDAPDSDIGAPAKYKYKHFLQLEDNDPRVTLNKLTGMGLDALNDVTTAQLSGLVPHLRLFKTITENKKTINVEFPFDKFTTMDSITSSREGRGTAAGIISIDWKDTGGQPATQGKSFTGKMKLHFQSLEAIFMPMEIGGQKIAYSDLMDQRGSNPRNFDPSGMVVDGPGTPEDHMGHILQSKVVDPTATTTVDSSVEPCEESNTNIVLEAGWSVASSKLLNLKKNKIDTALYNMRRRFILTVWKSEVMVTENGDVDVVLDFYGAIEGMALSTHSDIINLDETNLKSLPSSVQDLKAKMKEVEEKIGQTHTVEERITKTRKAAKEKLTRKDKNKIAVERRKRKTYEKAFKTHQSDLDKQAYGHIMALIRTSIARKGAGGESRVFYTDVSPSHLRLYTELLNIQAKKYKFEEGSTREEEKKAIEEYEESRKQKQEQLLNSSTTIGETKGFYWEAAQDTSNKDNMKKLKKLVRSKLGAMTAQGYIPKIDGNLRIQYIFLGDIIEAVMDRIYERRNLVGNKVGSKGDVCSFLRERLKVMLGSIVLPDPWNSDITHTVALSDIPVSVNYFNAWWFENVVGQNRKHYMLLNFLQDLTGKLINNAMSPNRYGGMPGKSPIFSHQILTLRAKNPLDNEWLGVPKQSTPKTPSDKPKKRIDIDKMLPGGTLSRTQGQQNVYSQWLYVYASAQPRVVRKESKWQPRGFADADKKQNIPHFMVGADKGMIQSIKFSRNKLQGQMEVALEQRSKAQGSKAIRANLLYQDMYNAQIKLFGNPAFKIGQMIYLDPRSMGVTPGHKTATLNIGGYYRITQISNMGGVDIFETDIKAVQEIGARQIRELRLQDKMDGVVATQRSAGRV